MPNRNCALVTSNVNYNISGTNEGSVITTVSPLLNSSNIPAFPLVGVTGLYFNGESGSYGSGNATSDQDGILYEMQGIGYPTYTDTGISVAHNGTPQRVGGRVYSGSNVHNVNNLRYYNGAKLQIPLLSPEAVQTISVTSINLTTIVGHTYAWSSPYSGTVTGPFPYGSLSLTIGTGLSVGAGNTVYVTRNTTNYLWGTVTSYNSGTGALVMNVIYATGSGTYSSWTVSVTPIGAGALCISKGGTTYNLPQASLAQPVDASGYTGYSSTLPATYSNGGGSGGVGVAITTLYAQPYTLTSIYFTMFLYAYSYGDNGRSGQAVFTIYYSTAPVGNTPSWVSLTTNSVSYGS